MRISLFLSLCTMAAAQVPDIIEGVSYDDRKAIRPSMESGDYSLLETASQRKDLSLLWFVIQAKSAWNSPLEKAFFEKAKSLLSQIPGHTQRHIDIIEEKAAISKELALRPDGTPNWYPPKGHVIKSKEEFHDWEVKEGLSAVLTDREFMQLSQLGSDECVQTLLTYVEDEREVGFIADADARHRPAYPNRCKALDALRRILGDSRPDKDVVGERSIYHPGNMGAASERYREWWFSEKSLPWREVIYPTSRAPILAKLSLEETKQETQSFGDGWLYLVCGFLVLIVIWLSAKRTRLFR